VKHRRAAAAYAKALFAVAKKEGRIEAVGRELGEIAALFDSGATLRDVFARPWDTAVGATGRCDRDRAAIASLGAHEPLRRAPRGAPPSRGP
jgi:hypothetical protein